MFTEWLEKNNPFNDPDWEMPTREQVEDHIKTLTQEYLDPNIKGSSRTKLVYSLCNAYAILSILNKPKKKGKWVWVEDKNKLLELG